MKKNRMKKISLTASLVLLCLVKQSAQTVYTVTLKTNPIGGVAPATGQLVWAINSANANPGESIINFNIPGSPPYNIQLSNTLPPLKRTIFIDGTTQPGYDANDPGNPVIVLDGGGA